MSLRPAVAVFLWLASVLAVWPVSRLPTPLRTAVGAILVTALILAAWVAGFPESYETAIAALVAGTAAFRAYDYLASPPPAGARGSTPLGCLVYLFAWAAADVSQFLAPLPGSRARAWLSGGCRGLLKLLAAGALLVAGFRWGLPERSAVEDHGMNLVEIYLFGSGASDLVVSFWALLGFRHPDAFDHLFLSRSVLEFWSRYDRWVFVWLKKHVFERVGRRRPVRAVIATFGVSGLMHAVLFSEALPSAAIAGSQLAFFLIQGVGALAGEPLSRRLRRRGRTGRVTARALTIAFVVLTSAVFMVAVNALGSLHGRTGAWLSRLL